MYTLLLFALSLWVVFDDIQRLLELNCLTV